MDNPIQRITPLVSSLEITLEQCTTALNGGGDVAQVIHCLTTIKQALAKLRTVIDTLVQMEEQQSLALFGINDAAIELVLSLDEKQPNYKPRPHAENVELIYSILEWCPDAPLPPDNVANMPVKKEVH